MRELNLAELEAVSGGYLAGLALSVGRYVAINSAISTALYGVNRALAGEEWNAGELAGAIGAGVALGQVKNVNTIGAGVAAIGGAIQGLYNRRGLIYDTLLKEDEDTTSPKLPAGQTLI